MANNVLIPKTAGDFFKMRKDQYELFVDPKEAACLEAMPIIVQNVIKDACDDFLAHDTWFKGLDEDQYYEAPVTFETMYEYLEKQVHPRVQPCVVKAYIRAWLWLNTDTLFLYFDERLREHMHISAAPEGPQND